MVRYIRFQNGMGRMLYRISLDSPAPLSEVLEMLGKSFYLGDHRLEETGALWVTVFGSRRRNRYSRGVQFPVS